MVYIPQQGQSSLEVIKSVISNQKSSSSLSFAIKDAFNTENPEVVFQVDNQTHKLMFQKEESRKEMESKLLSFGSEYSDIQFLMKKVQRVEQDLIEKMNCSEMVLANSNKKISELLADHKNNTSYIEKEIEYIKVKNYEGLSKVVNEHKKSKLKEGERLAHDRELSELDIKYEEITGLVRFCIGKENGCNQNGSIYGENPYTTDDGGMYCLAALHSGVIDETGGFFTVKLIGNIPNFPGNLKNGISSCSWSSSWNAYTIHACDEDMTEKEETYCKQIS
eukprot:CAMPEP_0170523408 /NCGR_PEP_ID=MMETSP0209-20121228/8843_1 /TAXON_ID=665100 ORGANISM="Litonotus pictus, Strain P1" /NCGR_SAMPLE_ID=MMETSP0209 /ASSEMBLY_ACC=CAM_ASM_000301 /LENGTH=277 /DNA_ID=CAMNT_0010811485 /DNA_START=34 /DNA_END=867 /DNA_ORIENTATION=+